MNIAALILHESAIKFTFLKARGAGANTYALKSFLRWVDVSLMRFQPQLLKEPEPRVESDAMRSIP